MKKITTIKLKSEDTGLIFRGDGKMELYLRNVRDKENSAPSENEILAFVLSNLLKDPIWVEQQIKLYENKGKVVQ